MMLHEEIDETRIISDHSTSDANWSGNEYFWKNHERHLRHPRRSSDTTPAPEGGGGATSSSDAAAAGSVIDVAAILDKAVARKKEKLTWRTSIVDLLG